MDDQELLHRVGEIVRQDEIDAAERDDRYRRLAEGTLSAEDDAELRALAESSEEARLDYEAYRPVGPETRERLAEAFQRQAPSRVVPFERPAARPSPAPRRSWQRSWRRLGGAAAVLAAALAFLWLRVPSGSGLSPLPIYLHELEGAVRDQRGATPDEETDRPTFRLGDTLRLVLRPPERVEGALAQRAFLEREGETVLRETVPIQVAYSVSADGVVTLEAELGRELELGAWELVVVYGRLGFLPQEIPPPGEESEAADWRVLRLPIRIVEGEDLSQALDVHYAGCYAVRLAIEHGEAECVPYPDLALWARPPPGGEFEVWIGGEPADPAAFETHTTPDGGRRILLRGVSAAAGEIELRALPSGSAPSWHLRLTPNPEPDWLKEIRRGFYSEPPDTLRRRLTEHLSAAPPALAASLHSLLARLPGADAEPHLEQAVALHREAGALLQWSEDLAMLLHRDFRERRFAEARRRLDDLVSAMPPDAPVEMRFLAVYSRGVLESRTGSLDAALDSVLRAAELAERVGLAEKRALADEKAALLLRSLGRIDASLEIFARLDPSLLRAPCDRVNLLNNHAWTRILTALASPAKADALLASSLPLLGDALRRAEDGQCRADLRLDLLLNRALAHTLLGESYEAFADLGRADDLMDAGSAAHGAWRRDIEARLALQAGDAAGALADWTRMEEIARGGYLPEERWLAKVGGARASARLGDLSGALERLAEAEELLDAQSLEIPLHGGREIFAAQRESGTALDLELLLDAGRPADALAVARRARARTARGLRDGRRLATLDVDRRARWDLEISTYLRLRGELEHAAGEDRQALDRRALPSDLLGQLETRRRELENATDAALDRAYRALRSAGDGPSPHGLDAPDVGRPGVLTLLVHPLPGIDAWVVFAAHDGRVDSHRFVLGDGDAMSPAALAGHLLEPFDARIASASTVRVMPYGELAAVDFHALPWRGDALLASLPVVYDLDLGRSSREPSPRLPRRALILADPTGDLPAAGREAEAVRGALKSADWEVTLRARRSADRRALRLGLADPSVDLLHYAGHGAADGWRSALLLGDHARFTLGDVLALERAPRGVVLSSCETARPVEERGTAVLGLAQAFLIAGAEWVIAAARPVGDQASEELFGLFYREFGEGESDPATALRRAQMAWRETYPGGDWASFRLLEP